jgi:hypothetical protein
MMLQPGESASSNTVAPVAEVLFIEDVAFILRTSRSTIERRRRSGSTVEYRLEGSILGRHGCHEGRAEENVSTADGFRGSHE